MRATKKVSIAGDEYELTQLGAVQGRKLWLLLLQALAEPLKVASAAATLDEVSVAAAIAAAIASLEESTLERLYDAFGKSSTVQILSDKGERWPELTGNTFDEHFAGRYVAMSQWLLECVIFNFADFLGEASLGSVVDTIRAAARRRESPKDSTGSSGESSPTSTPR